MPVPKKRKVWKRVKAPKSWRPTEGEELIGEFLGSDVAVGEYGEYKRHYVRREDESVVYVTGSRSDQLFALVKADGEVKVVFNGMRQCVTSDRTYKDIDVFTRDEVSVELRVTSTRAS